jgi:hypothetical protein
MIIEKKCLMNGSNMIIFDWRNFRLCNSGFEPGLEISLIDFLVGYCGDRRDLNIGKVTLDRKYDAIYFICSYFFHLYWSDWSF